MFPGWAYDYLFAMKLLNAIPGRSLLKARKLRYIRFAFHLPLLNDALRILSE